MTISAANVRKLNKMNTSACEVGLGDEVSRLGVAAATQLALIGSSGSIVAGGSRVVIQTGLTAPKGIIVQANSSGSRGTLPLYVSTGSVTGTYAITSASDVAALGATDVITWVAFS